MGAQRLYALGMGLILLKEGWRPPKVFDSEKDSSLKPLLSNMYGFLILYREVRCGIQILDSVVISFP